MSEALARARASAIRDVRYDVVLRIPGDRVRPVEGRVVVRFTLRAPTDVVLDFAQAAERVRAVRSGDREVPFTARNGHIVVAADVTRAGENAIAVEFVAGDEALNRGEDFLYTLFVPSRAQLAFPCFDQPDLKARYTLTLTLPASWQVAANAAESAEPRAEEPGTVTRRFAETKPLPTYLFAFAAGRFSVETATRNGREMRMLHRETDAAKVARNKEQIFDLHATALAWLEDYTGIPYPFGKFDFVLIPSFQFGGMEHAGAILYNAAGLMLDASATQNQLLGRASVIAHESAHMWFGDLVTMRWFNDVWTKEVFANFMAAKIVNPSFPQVNHELRFLLDHYPSAYQVDRTAGTNAVRQTLGNLNDAGQMYGPIIYDKAPVVMRQLELMVGESAFREGMREYLRRFAYGNATWPELVRILDARTPRDLASWSRAWVDERGRPEFVTAVRLDASGRVSDLTLTQRDPLARGIVWPQRLQVTLGYGGSAKDLTVDVATPAHGNQGGRRPRRAALHPAERRRARLRLLPAGRPQPPVPGGAHRGRGRSADARQRVGHAVGQHAGAPRAPDALFAAAVRALGRETDEQNAQRVLTYAVRAYWRYLTPPQRAARIPAFEAALRAGLARAATQSQKAAWFNAFRDVVASAEGTAWLERVWRRQEQVPGLTLAEQDEIVMAFELAVREVPGWQKILAAQLERTENPDRKARFAFVMPALSADAGERERAFERFAALENRRREAWVLESLQYLNHPLRSAHAVRFVPRALEMLREIQQTGDIFFPTRWTESSLWGHQSPEVAAIVRAFLARNRTYPTRLRWTVLSAADDLFRSAAMQTSPSG